MANSSAAGVATLQIDSWKHPFTRKTLAQLGLLFPDFLAGRRWFRAKARTIQETAAEDVLEAGDARILVMHVQYTDGGSERYLVPLGVARSLPPGCTEVFASLAAPGGESGVLYGALWDPAFRGALLRSIAENDVFCGSKGDLVAQRTHAFDIESAGQIESSLIKAEQSNSSVVYGDRCILKLFRKLEAGINPDAEIGTFLTERGFRHTPEVLGTLEYRTQSATYSTGILQRFVRNRGDAWAFALESLSEFFRRVAAEKPGVFAPTPKSFHPLDLAQEAPPDEVQDMLGPFAGKVKLLGERTAEMHAALCDPGAGPDFAPEPFTREAAGKACAEMLAQADIAFELVRRKQTALPEDVAASARQLLQLEHRVADHFLRFRDFPASVARIRHHGDFHLGQVLYTGDDFMLIDFEGEPSRPLSSRRAKALALRDVAGMIRSFQYAAYAALLAEFPDAPARQDISPALESWAVCWSAWVSAMYTSAYFERGSAAFVGASPEERRVLLDAFLLEKVLYEIGYELNNRPDWVRIPLRGALSLA